VVPTLLTTRQVLHVYFDLNDEQQQIKATAREFLTSRYKPERIRELTETDLGFEESDWQEMVELGWPGLAPPQGDGGPGPGVCSSVG